jgi:hypothetical protein
MDALLAALAQDAIQRCHKTAKLEAMPVSNSALPPLAALLQQHRVTVTWLRCYLKQRELELLGSLSLFQGAFRVEAAVEAAACCGAQGDAGEALLEALVNVSVLQRVQSGGGSGGARLAMHLLYRELAHELHTRSFSLLVGLIWAAILCASYAVSYALFRCVPFVLYALDMEAQMFTALNKMLWGLGYVVELTLISVTLVVFISNVKVLYRAPAFGMVVRCTRPMARADATADATTDALAAACLFFSSLVMSRHRFGQAQMVRWVLLDRNGPGQSLARLSAGDPASGGISECREIVRADDANLKNATRLLEEVEDSRSWPYAESPLEAEQIMHVCRAALAMVGAGCARRGGQLASFLLKASSKVLGEGHRTTLVAMGCHASAVYALGDWRRARELQEEVLALRRRVLGAEHWDTLAAMSQLAVTLASLDKHAAARTLQVRVLAAMVATPLGLNNLWALQTSSDLAASMWHLGEQEAAIQQASTVVESMQVLGPRAPSTLAAAGHLAWYHSKKGEHDRAREMQQSI